MQITEAIAREAHTRERRRLQTDLWHLAHVLYPLSKGHYWSERVHRPVCKFFVQKNPDRLLADQDKRKQRLLLDPRNHFKTTLDICDIVQWILCFPDIRVLIASGTRDNATKMLGAVKGHFQYNPVIRALFPELCPKAHKVEDWGRQESFTCPGRKNKTLREPTCSIASPDATVAGMHYDVLKFDDLVNETNSRTAEGLQQVIHWYRLTSPLLEPYGYRDVIGTRYDYSDLYGEVLGEDYTGANLEGADRNGYFVFKRSAYCSDGTVMFPERFSDDPRKPDERQAVARLEREKLGMGAALFSGQYINNPVPSDSQYFPLDLVARTITKIRPKVHSKRFITLDMAGPSADVTRGDRDAFVVCFVAQGDTDPRPVLYVEHITVGQLSVFDKVRRLFDLNARFKPLTIRTEDVGFQRMLEAAVQVESRAKHTYLPLQWVKRNTQVAKRERIAALQAWFERGDIRILDTCPHKEDLVLELVRFPKYRRDDIIDALADQLANVSWFQPTGANALPDLTQVSGDPRIGLLA